MHYIPVYFVSLGLRSRLGSIPTLHDNGAPFSGISLPFFLFWHRTANEESGLPPRCPISQINLECVRVRLHSIFSLPLFFPLPLPSSRFHFPYTQDPSHMLQIIAIITLVRGVVSPTHLIHNVMISWLLMSCGSGNTICSVERGTFRASLTSGSLSRYSASQGRDLRLPCDHFLHTIIRSCMLTIFTFFPDISMLLHSPASYRMSVLKIFSHSCS